MAMVMMCANLAAQMWKAPFVQYGSARLFLRSAPPSTWPTPVPLQGALAPNDALQTSLERLLDGELPGQPETVVFGDDGRVFAMLEGDVWVAEGPNGSNPQLYAHTGGRPLGGKFDASGNLVYADGTGGLLMIEAGSRRVVKLTDRVSDDSPLEPDSLIYYADDLDIGASGLVYFSDAAAMGPARSTDGRYDTLGAAKAAFVQGPTGRLLTYDPATGATHVLATGLWFANGVALAADESFVVVGSTFSARLYRHWLQGPKAGVTEPFAEMPGMVDGVSLASDGGFWVAICAPMSDLVRIAAGHNSIRFWLGWLPEQLAPQATPSGMVVKVSSDGQITQMLQDPTGKEADMVTAVTEYEGKLYLGSLAKSYIGVYDLNKNGAKAVE